MQESLTLQRKNESYALGYELLRPQHSASSFPIILLNGSLFNYRQWDLLVKAGLHPKKSGYPLLRYDYGGTGRSLKKSVTWNVFEIADELKALLDSLSFSRVHLYGISKGTIIGQVFAARYPEYVASLAGYGWFHFAYSRMKGVREFFGERTAHFSYLSERDANPLTFNEFTEIWNDVFNVVLFHRKQKLPWWKEFIVGKLFKKRIFALLEPTPARVMYDWFHYAVMMMESSGGMFKESYQKLDKVPMLIQHAKKDGTLPYGMAEELSKKLPHAKLIQYGKGYNHISVTISSWQAKKVVKDYLDFLQSLPS